MKKTYVEYELANGNCGNERILAIDKIKMEKTMRANSWTLADGPRSASLLLFFALQRKALIASNYESFIETELIDWTGGDDPDDTPAEGDENPS